jgi:two-component system, OmpR family, phosphate regulon sensor histidine kinase PhoR
MATETVRPREDKLASESPRRRYWKIFAITYIAFLSMIAIVAGSVGYSLRANVEKSMQGEITRNLTQKAQMLANRVHADHAHGIDVISSQEGQAAGARATVIDTNGQIVADSEIPVSSLHDEGRQPEFATALRGSTGVEIRSHNGAQVLFVAVPVSGGAVRLAYPLADVEAAESEVSHRLLIACVLAIAVAGLLSALLSHVVLLR